MNVIGIDPGKQGGISIMSATEVAIEKLPQNSKDLLELVQMVGEVECAYVEQIYLPTGKAGALNFASGWGKILAVLEIAEIRTELVRPQVWMKTLDCMTKGDKNITKRKADELFGHLEYEGGKTLPITHWSSDALLIGYYGFLTEGNNGQLNLR